jgi:hypothetical protein
MDFQFNLESSETLSPKHATFYLGKDQTQPLRHPSHLNTLEFIIQLIILTRLLKLILFVGTRKHQKFWIGGFKCQIRIFPGDLSIVQGFCEV